MSETSWQERRDFEERIQDGQNLTAQETHRLIEDADAAERSVAILEGLQLSLKSQFGILLVDATTDDDDGEIRIELIQAEDGSEPCENLSDDKVACGNPGKWYDGGNQNGSGWYLCPSCAEGYALLYDEAER